MTKRDIQPVTDVRTRLLLRDIRSSDREIGAGTVSSHSAVMKRLLRRLRVRRTATARNKTAAA